MMQSLEDFLLEGRVLLGEEISTFHVHRLAAVIQGFGFRVGLNRGYPETARNSQDIPRWTMILATLR